MARRVNTRFLAILAAGLLAVVVGIVVATQFFIRESPKKLMQDAVDDLGKHNYEAAADAAARAWRLAPKDSATQIQIQLLSAAAARELAKTDVSRARDERGAYETILQIDPNNLSAMKGMVGWCLATIQNPLRGLNAKVYRNLADYSRRAYELDHTNTSFQPLPAIAVLEQAVGGFGYDAKELDGAVKDLQGLMAKDPANADIPYQIARAKLYQGVMLSQQSNADTAKVTDLYGQAKKVFDDALTNDDAKKNASMHWRFSRVLASLSVEDHSDPANKDKYIKLAQEESDKARTLVTDSDPNYQQINFDAAALAQSRKDTAGAIAIMNNLPATPDRDLRLAEMLKSDPSTVLQAITLLEKQVTALKAMDNMDLFRFQFVHELNDCRIVHYGDPHTVEPEKSQLKTKITETLATMRIKQGMYGIAEEAIDMQEAQFLLAQNDSVGALKILQKLITIDARRARDPYVLSKLASAYSMAGQSEEAIKYVSDLVAKYPDATDPRIFLVGLLLEHSPERAGPHLDMLEKLLPDDPRVIDARIRWLHWGGEKNSDLVKKYFDRLPETTDVQIVQKARWATQVHAWDVAIGLFHKLDPKYHGDADFSVNLANLYLASNQKDQALAVAQEAQKLHPDSAPLKLLIQKIQGTNAAEMAKTSEEMVKAISDPLRREAGLADLARERNDPKSYEEHLKEAEKLTGTSVQDQTAICTVLFSFYIDARRFDDAAIYEEKLAKLNADKANGNLYRFTLLHAKGDNVQALQVATQLTKDYPDFANVWMALGQAQQALGQYEQALRQYVIVLQKQGDNVQAMDSMIDCQYALGRKDDALHTIQQALARSPDSPAFQMRLLKHQMDYGNWSDARSAVETQMKRDPENPQLWAMEGIVLMRGSAAVKADHDEKQATSLSDDALKVLQEAHKKFPDDAAVITDLADVLVQKGKVADAEDLLTAWTKKPGPAGAVAAMEALCNLYDQTQRPDKAEDLMRSILSLTGYRLDYEMKMADLLARHQKFSYALELLGVMNGDEPRVKRAVIQTLCEANVIDNMAAQELTRNKKDADAARAKATAAQRFDEAQARIQAGLTENSQNPATQVDLWNMWARLLFDNMKYDESIDKASKALEIDNNNRGALLVRARARLVKRVPDIQGALADLAPLHDLKDSQVILMTADCYIRTGKQEDAILELLKALKLDPSNKPARMKLAELYFNGSRPRISQAVQLLQEVESVEPYKSDPEFFRSEAVYLEANNDLAAAVAKIRQARGLDTTNKPELLRLYLNLLLKAQAYDQIIKETDPLLDDPHKTIWWFMLDRGLARKGLGDQGGAAADVTIAFADAQDDAKDAGAFSAAVDLVATQWSVDATIQLLQPFARDHLKARVMLVQMFMKKGDSAATAQAADTLLAGADQSSDLSDRFLIYNTAAMAYTGMTPQPMVDNALNAYQKAMDTYQKALDAYQKDLDGYQKALDAHQAGSDIQRKALDTQLKVAWLRSRIPAILNNYACLLVDYCTPPRTQEALPYAQKAVDEMTKNAQPDPNFRETLGWVLVLNGQLTEGIAQLRQVLETAPSGTAYLHLGEAYLKKSMPDDAIRQAEFGLKWLQKQGNNDKILEAKLTDLNARSKDLKAKARTPSAP